MDNVGPLAHFPPRNKAAIAALADLFTHIEQAEPA